jgi:hypothetical protein
MDGSSRSTAIQAAGRAAGDPTAITKPGHAPAASLGAAPVPTPTDIALPDAAHARQAGQLLYLVNLVNLAASIAVALVWRERADERVPFLLEAGLTAWFVFDFVPVLVAFAGANALKHLKRRAWAYLGCACLLLLVLARTVAIQWLKTLPVDPADAILMHVQALCIVTIVLNLIAGLQTLATLGRPALRRAFR